MVDIYIYIVRDEKCARAILLVVLGCFVRNEGDCKRANGDCEINFKGMSVAVCGSFVGIIFVFVTEGWHRAREGEREDENTVQRKKNICMYISF